MLPLTLACLADGVVVSQFPDGAEVVEKLSADRVPVEDWGAEQNEGQPGDGQEEEVEVGVRVGQEGRLALRAEAENLFGGNFAIIVVF